MSIELNQEHVNDTAKLIIHRLTARAISRDPSLVEKAKISLDRSSQHFEGYSFVREWSELLDLPPSEIRHLLASRSERMTRVCVFRRRSFWLRESTSVTRRCVAVSGGRQNASLEGRRRSRSSRGWLREATLVRPNFRRPCRDGPSDSSAVQNRQGFHVDSRGDQRKRHSRCCLNACVARQRISASPVVDKAESAGRRVVKILACFAETFNIDSSGRYSL